MHKITNELRHKAHTNYIYYNATEIMIMVNHG